MPLLVLRMAPTANRQDLNHGGECTDIHRYSTRLLYTRVFFQRLPQSPSVLFPRLEKHHALALYWHEIYFARDRSLRIAALVLLLELMLASVKHRKG